MKKITCVIIILFIGHVLWAQGKKPIVASDLLKIATAGQTQISPDGTKAITVVTRKAVKNDNEYYYTRHLYLLDLSGTTDPAQLTYGDKNDGQPQWSPDGTQIAFVRADGDKSQIWLLPLKGGEAHSITKSEYGVSNPRWSPDGKKILYSSNIPSYAIEGKTSWTYERPGRNQGDEPNFKLMKADEKKKTTTSPDGTLEEIRAWLAKNASESNPRVLNRQNIQGELNLQPDEEFSHLFIKTVASEDKPAQLTNGLQDFAGARWSPDGRSIICHSKAYKIHPDRERDNDLWIIDVDSKVAKELLTWNGYSISNPVYSPDGTQILFFAQSTQNRHATQTQLASMILAGGKPQALTATLDRDVNGAVWSSDSKTIYFLAPTEGDVPLFSVPAKGGAVTKLVGDNSGVSDIDVRGEKIVFSLTEVKNPREIYMLNLRDKSTRQLTKLNEGWLKDKQVIMPKEYWLDRPDGTKVQYWVMEPVGKKDGIKYPTILNIHGGPAAMWGPGESSMWHEYQLENSWGYGLVYCNPRGSGGYGDKFKKGNFKDWGTGPAGDILGALDDAMSKNSWIDKDQLFAEGGSYAGYMVAWLVAHDNRFKAANAQRGVYDLTTFMGEGNAWSLVPNDFGGYPWQKETKALLDANSPYTYVDKINTPLLIIHGDQDLRTGVIQSEMLYKSLKLLNKPVEYVRYPKEGHELTRSGNPGRMMDHMLRVIEFFERYAKHPEPVAAGSKIN
jgi:dipeptidyl aminopeptidase/acylaminoacyl peptidase